MGASVCGVSHDPTMSTRKDSFPDVLDSTFQRIFDKEFEESLSQLPVLFELAGDLPAVSRWRRLWWRVCRPFSWLRWEIVDLLTAPSLSWRRFRSWVRRFFL